MKFLRKWLSHQSAEIKTQSQDFSQTQEFVTLTNQTMETQKKLAEETDKLKKLLDRLKENG